MGGGELETVRIYNWLTEVFICRSISLSLLTYIYVPNPYIYGEQCDFIMRVNVFSGLAWSLWQTISRLKCSHQLAKFVIETVSLVCLTPFGFSCERREEHIDREICLVARCCHSKHSVSRCHTRFAPCRQIHIDQCGPYPSRSESTAALISAHRSAQRKPLMQNWLNRINRRLFC